MRLIFILKRRNTELILHSFKKNTISPLPYSYIDFNDCWSYLDFWPSQNNQIKKGTLSLSCPFLLPAVPQKRFGSADCDTIYTIYVSLCTQTADPNPFRGPYFAFFASSVLFQATAFTEKIQFTLRNIYGISTE